MSILILRRQQVEALLRLAFVNNIAEGIVSYIAMSFVLVSTVVMALNTIQGLKVSPECVSELTSLSPCSGDE